MTAQQRQEFCVRWNSHLGSIGAAFPQLLAGQRFVDVTLACEGHQVHCHRLVLAACSSYFESILAENPCKHPVIILPSEIKLWEIQALVDFMYKGEVNVTQAGLPNLLRCAEQLRIRGLYGSDAALNLNQLKALSNKAISSVSNTAAVSSAVAAASSANNTNDSTETDNDSATTTTTATTATSAVAMRHAVNEASLDFNKQHQTQQQQQLQHQQQNGSITTAQQQHQQMLQLQQQQQQQQNNLQLQHQMNAMLKQQQETTNASNATEDDSADESTSNACDNEEEYLDKPPKIECTIEEESFVGNDEDSFGGVEMEHDLSSGGGVGGSNGNLGNISVVNAAMLQNSMDGGSAYKRIRRSEASLAQAAKCVSKGQTFQTVSNMFNIPVSTIRFYMARKGILPKRKRGRGASTTASGATLSSAVMSQALAQMKRSGSPVLEPPYHLIGTGYKLPEQQGATANII